MSSERLDPSFSIEDEEAGVPAELKPVVMGPPGFASPDPQTQAARLDVVDTHINRDAIDESYGAGVDSVPGPDHTASADDFKAGEPEDGYDSLKKDELVEIARQRGLSGFSSMSKDELVSALEADDDEADDEADDEEN